MKATITELRHIANKLFDHLESRQIRDVELMDDYYWHIPKDQWTNADAEPTSFTVGQLTDNLNELRRISKGERPASGLALTWLATVLRMVGEKEVA